MQNDAQITRVVNPAQFCVHVKNDFGRDRCNGRTWRARSPAQERGMGQFVVTMVKRPKEINRIRKFISSLLFFLQETSAGLTKMGKVMSEYNTITNVLSLHLFSVPNRENGYMHDHRYLNMY